MVSDEQVAGLPALLEHLGDAVAAPTVEQRAGAVKRVLAETIRTRALRLPERFYVPKAECYARRLLPRDV